MLFMIVNLYVRKLPRLWGLNEIQRKSVRITLFLLNV